MLERLRNYVNGTWQASAASEVLPVLNPASGAVLAEVPLSPAAEVDAAVQAAVKAFATWRRTPAGERIQPLFRLKQLLEDHLDSLAQHHHGRMRKDVRRGRRRDAARRRECRGRLRDSGADARTQ